MTITVKGQRMHLLGNPVEVGQEAPNFSLCSTDMKEVTLANFKGKTLVVSVVPSLDTAVCDRQARRFDEEAKLLGPNVVVMVVSLDLPFAQDRWKKTASCSSVETYSDYKDRSFGMAYGVLIDELKLLARSIFVIDGSARIAYKEIVSELTSLPNFEQVLHFLKAKNA